MSKTMIRPVLIFLSICLCACSPQPEPDHRLQMDYVELVNPLMGTASEYKLSNGNTYPAVARPWGMNFWTPQTAPMGDGWMYSYYAYQIRGFRQTHQPSPWINDYGAFSLMPVTGGLKFTEDDRSSWFSHKAEIARPYYYQVYLADHDVTVELAPTERSAYFKFTFPASDSSLVVLDAFKQGSMVRIIPEERRIVGFCRNNSGGVPENFRNYFVAQFDKDFDFSRTWTGEGASGEDLQIEGDHVGAMVGFSTGKGEVIHVRVASSFISLEQARLNLDREIGTRAFSQIKAEGKEAWNRELGRIHAEGSDVEHLKTFYSCLYRVLLFPRKFFEYDQHDQLVHYSPYNGEVLPGYMFTDNGFWDTFRAVFPFFTLMYPELNSQIMQGLVNAYKESGWLPEWASPGHRGSMIGSNSSSIIADSYLKGIRGYDIQTLYQAMMKNTQGVGPIHSVGRYGAEYYNDLGYVPYDVGINENAARTLEYAYADFVISELAQAIGRPPLEVDLFRRRAQNYRNLFDPEYKLMRGKNQDGSFQTPFNPFKWGDAFTEGNSWHYTWSVFHDIAGLIELMGGKEPFNAMLDSVFSLPPVYDESYYGQVIHEIREMQIANTGQYAHGNQPIQHMIYLYNYSGQPWKAQHWARQVMDQLYSSAPDGYCGDEDNGQTSAWYVFSALGFYPVCPGTQQYVLGTPLFNRVRLDLENGNQFVIEAPANNHQNRYIASLKLNGQDLNRTWIDHAEVINGGKLEFALDSVPHPIWGAQDSSTPFSVSN